MPRRYVFSLVRCVPNPRTGEFVNVGAIAGDPESEDWSVRQVGQWITAVRAATRHQAITLGAEPGTRGGPTVFSLIHTHCQRRPPDGTGSGPATSPS